MKQSVTSAGGGGSGGDGGTQVVDAHVWLEDEQGRIYDWFDNWSEVACTQGLDIDVKHNEVCCGATRESLAHRGLVYRSLPLPLSQSLFWHWSRRMDYNLMQRLGRSLVHCQNEEETVPKGTVVTRITPPA